MRYLDALNEKFDKQYGTNKDSRSASRHVTNPGQSKAQHRADAIEFLKKHRKKKKKQETNESMKPLPAGRVSHSGKKKDEFVTGGKHGMATVPGRLTTGRRSADVRVKNYTAGPKGRLPGRREHIEYKRMGLLMAESLGYRIDEFLPALAAGAARLGGLAARGVGAAARLGAKALGGAARAVGGAAKGAVGDAAKDKAKEKAKEKLKKELGVDMEEANTDNDPPSPKKPKVRRRRDPLEGVRIKRVNLSKLPKRKDGGSMELEDRYKLPPLVEPGKRKDESFYFEMGMLIAEVTKRVGPIASGYSNRGRVKSKKKGEGSRSIGDPVVRREVEAANTRVGKKLGIKANLETDVAAQQGLENRRRRFRRKGIGLPAPSRKEREADAREDQRRRQAPDDK